MNHQISPKYTIEKLNNPSLKDVLDVFEDRIRGWVLGPAEILLKNPNGRIASICLQLTYFEGIWAYVMGSDSSRKSQTFFRNGFVDVFRHTRTSERLLERAADILYQDARCGFFHDGMFRSRLFFTSRGFALEITLPKKNGKIDETGKIHSIMIDPCAFFDAIVRHFEAFVSKLREGSDSEAIRKFMAIWNQRRGDPIFIGISDPNDSAS